MKPSYTKNEKNVKINKNKKSNLVPKITKQEQWDWFYMVSEDISIGDIAVCLKEAGYTEIDLWEEMGVLQIELPGGTCIDFELLTTPFKDASDKAFIESRSIKKIYTVTLEKGTFEELRDVMCKILSKYSGILCGDTIDFNPVYNKENM